MNAQTPDQARPWMPREPSAAFFVAEFLRGYPESVLDEIVADMAMDHPDEAGRVVEYARALRNGAVNPTLSALDIEVLGWRATEALDALPRVDTRAVVAVLLLMFWYHQNPKSNCHDKIHAVFVSIYYLHQECSTRDRVLLNAALEAMASGTGEADRGNRVLAAGLACAQILSAARAARRGRMLLDANGLPDVPESRALLYLEVIEPDEAFVKTLQEMLGAAVQDIDGFRPYIAQCVPGRADGLPHRPLRGGRPAGLPGSCAGARIRAAAACGELDRGHQEQIVVRQKAAAECERKAADCAQRTQPPCGVDKNPRKQDLLMIDAPFPFSRGGIDNITATVAAREWLEPAECDALRQSLLTHHANSDLLDDDALEALRLVALEGLRSIGSASSSRLADGEVRAHAECQAFLFCEHVSGRIYELGSLGYLGGALLEIHILDSVQIMSLHSAIYHAHSMAAESERYIPDLVLECANVLLGRYWIRRAAPTDAASKLSSIDSDGVDDKRVWRQVLLACQQIGA